MDNLLEIELKADNKVVLETLSRIGIANKNKKILYPSCYLHEIDGQHFLVHFKQMFQLTREDAYNNVGPDDINRRNAIAFCLIRWGLIDVIDKESMEPHDKRVFVLPHQDKDDWKISHKFNIRNLEL